MEAQRPASRVAVVGGGIAGLACARALVTRRPDLDVTVYEASSRVGGKLAVGEVAGVSVDLGAESVLNRRSEGTGLARAVGLGDSIVYPEVSGAGIWTRGAMRPLPSSLMGVPTSLSAAADSKVLSRRGLARAAMEGLLPRLVLEEDVGVGVIVAKRLGVEVRDRLVEPLLGGVYAGRSDEISVQAALPQLVTAIERHGSLLAAAAAASSPPAVAATPLFAGIRGGVGRLPQAVIEDFQRRGGSLVLNAPVRELSRAADGWTLTVGATTDATAVTADVVVLATPAGPTARLLRKVAPRVSGELADIDYASVAIITLAVPAAAVPSGMTGTGFLVPPVDGLPVKAATYSSQKWAWLQGDSAFFRCSIGRHREVASLQREDSELVATARAQLSSAVGLQGPLVDATVTRWGGALPQYAVGHRGRVARIRADVDAVPGLELCGAAYDGVGVPAVVAGGEEGATRVIAALDLAGTMSP
jgi:oxygen-dependent protoporphyrinogen oxidase